jgi:membrane protein implicated in regulation of membrane protease activity
MLTAIAGGLLLFGAAEHLLAKTMSLIVGVGLGAAAVIALISGDALGLAAANHVTELAWGIAAAILLVNTLAPRRRRRVTTVADDDAVDRRGRRLMRRRRRTAERVAPADEETRVMPEREPAAERVAPADEETHVMHEHEHEHEHAPFRPDDQETRVMAGRDTTVEPGTGQRP